MSDYYDPDGKPISVDEWKELWHKRHADDDDSWWRLGATEIGGVSVSTVWLGLDHSFGHGPPLIFETMIFGGDHDGDQWRYSTRDEALSGHEDAVALIRGDD